MSDTVFRNATPEVSQPETVPALKEPDVISTDHTEVPYLDYEHSTGHPLSVDYFHLGDTWEVFEGEVTQIETYIQQKVSSGEIANSLTAVKELLKGMEKTNNLTKEERAVVKVGVLSAYAKFLLETDGIKTNLRKYGTA